METKQDIAIKRILKGDNVFITGSGGVGKSYIINKVTSGKDSSGTVLAAPTGVAALNIGGATCHKTFSSLSASQHKGLQ